MVDISAVLLLLAGLCLCQANVIQLTNENFDSVSIKSEVSIEAFARALIIDASGVKL